jgi:DNA-binding CsgD family transcriptional regulator
MRELIEAKEACLKGMKAIEQCFNQSNFQKEDLLVFMRHEKHRLSNIPLNERVRGEWKRLNLLHAHKEIKKQYEILVRWLRELTGTARTRKVTHLHYGKDESFNAIVYGSDERKLLNDNPELQAIEIGLGIDGGKIPSTESKIKDLTQRETYLEQFFKDLLSEGFKPKFIIKDTVVFDWQEAIKRIDALTQGGVLTAEQGEAFELRLRGFSFAEIGTQLGISKNSTYERVKYAIKKLKQDTLLKKIFSGDT